MRSSAGWFSADDWSAVDAGFAAPPAEFRLSHYSAHDGAPLPVQQMAEAGIGGVSILKGQAQVTAGVSAESVSGSADAFSGVNFADTTGGLDVVSNGSSVFGG